jgi:predicted CXXCH cytochrome family protein
MRDHDAVSGGRGFSESRLAALAITSLIPGLDMPSANCLECHSTEEQRLRRNAETTGPAVPVTGGLYLGFMSPDGHPLGSERRSGPRGASEWASDPFRASPPGGAAGPRLGFTAAEVTCAGCHDPHEYDLRLGVADDERTVCLSCHDPTYYAFNAHVTPTCGDCHQQHNAPGPFLTVEVDLDGLCAACHEGTGGLTMNPADPSLYGPPSHLDLQPGRCGDCHKIHGEPGVG